MMQKYNVKKLIFSSSAVVYGLPKVTEMVAETIAKGPITSPYGRSKLMCEQMMEDLCHSEKGWKIASLRYFNPVGAHPAGIIGENPRGIPNNLMPFVAQVAATNIPASYSLTRKWSKTRILSVFGNDYPTPDGTGVRDYIHVCDLARGHVDALHWILSLKGHQSVYRPFNLGCGQGHSVLDVIETFEKVNQVKVPYRFTARRNGDVPKLVANPARANQELGFKCTKTLEDMCRDMWRWQRTLMRETEYELEE
jgi:UDP-glucose 4-epimerase